MALRLDPEEHEVDALHALLPKHSGLRVLEIGCGDGRLTRRYAHMADRIVAVDSSASELDEFRSTMPPAFAGRIELRTSPVETLHVPRDFDVVLMSWSL